MGKLPQKLMPVADRNQFAIEIYLPTGGWRSGRIVQDNRFSGGTGIPEGGCEYGMSVSSDCESGAKGMVQ